MATILWVTRDPEYNFCIFKMQKLYEDIACNLWVTCDPE